MRLWGHWGLGCLVTLIGIPFDVIILVVSRFTGLLFRWAEYHWERAEDLRRFKGDANDDPSLK